MVQTAPALSLAALGARVGPLVERHLERTFQALLRGPGVSRGPGYVRASTGAPHPFGNFAMLADADDAAQAIDTDASAD